MILSAEPSHAWRPRSARRGAGTRACRSRTTSSARGRASGRARRRPRRPPARAAAAAASRPVPGRRRPSESITWTRPARSPSCSRACSAGRRCRTCRRPDGSRRSRGRRRAAARRPPGSRRSTVATWSADRSVAQPLVVGVVVGDVALAHASPRHVHVQADLVDAVLGDQLARQVVAGVGDDRDRHPAAPYIVGARRRGRLAPSR